MSGKLWAAQPSDIQQLHTSGLPMPPWEAIDVPSQISAVETIADLTLNRPFGQRELYFYQELGGNLVLLVGLRASESSYSCHTIPVINPELANLIELSKIEKAR